jgi:acetoin utilization deacetylase AcuC-like enzyme
MPAPSEGSKGTWTAAVAAVGAALQAIDMIMTGEYTNAFCPTRPPGHHAGRELHAMKAVSNGFCVLNSVACAALYATMPILEGGLGLSRVCVIDIDVHHGNGTQDILCSTYDPRFLYVSMHAGGSHVNGVDLGDDGEQMMAHHLGRNLNKKGIFPGRCGDTSPHPGVLNIPLGSRVTSHALGTALVTKVGPTVDNYSPELIIVSAGFDAHKNDPLNMGGLNAEDFGTLTEVICKLAHKSCSGRVVSVLEGGYGVPCCRPQYFPPRDDLPTVPYDDWKYGAEKDFSAGAGSQVVQNSDPLKNSESVIVLSAGENSGIPKEQGDGNEEALTSQTLENGAFTTETEENAASQTPSSNEIGKMVVNGVGLPTSDSDEHKDDQLVPLQCLDLGEDMPPDMKDIVASYALQKRLDKCHAEGFLHCVREHVAALALCSSRR